MTTDRNEVKVNTSWQKALINHFIRELFNNKALSVDIPKYSPDEYLRVLREFTGPKTNSLQNSQENLPLDTHDQDILLSFLRHYALKTMTNCETIPIKDHLANYLCIDAMYRCLSSEQFMVPFGPDF